jgi:hypothetical protein
VIDDPQRRRQGLLKKMSFLSVRPRRAKSSKHSGT